MTNKTLAALASLVGFLGSCTPLDTHKSEEASYPYQQLSQEEVMDRAGVDKKENLDTVLDGQYVTSKEVRANLNIMTDVKERGVITYDGRKHTIWYDPGMVKDEKLKKAKEGLYRSADKQLDKGYGDHIISKNERDSVLREFLKEEGVSYSKYDSLGGR